MYNISVCPHWSPARAHASIRTRTHARMHTRTHTQQRTRTLTHTPAHARAHTQSFPVLESGGPILFFKKTRPSLPRLFTYMCIKSITIISAISAVCEIRTATLQFVSLHMQCRVFRTFVLNPLVYTKIAMVFRLTEPEQWSSMRGRWAHCW